MAVLDKVLYCTAPHRTQINLRTEGGVRGFFKPLNELGRILTCKAHEFKSSLSNGEEAPATLRSMPCRSVECRYRIPVHKSIPIHTVHVHVVRTETFLKALGGVGAHGGRKDMRCTDVKGSIMKTREKQCRATGRRTILVAF